MPSSHPHPIYSRDAKVWIVSGDDKLETLRRAVAGSGFLEHLEEAWRASAKPREAFRVAIKPNIMTASRHEEDSPVYTDPALVEELIRAMREQGFRQFAVVESQNVYNYAYTGRTVAAVAAMCGYSGEGYAIRDLTDDPVPLDYGGVLGRHLAGRAWIEADYRISFAKNKSHWQCFYTGCVKCVYGCLPRWDKMRHYHGKGVEFFQAAVLSAEKVPVHFGFLDAWTSGDGFAGHVRDATPNRTRSVLASPNIYALDWVMGEKMAVDPALNYVMQEAMHRWGAIRITRVGDTTPWPGWTNLRAATVVALNVFEELYWVSRVASRALASGMDRRFRPRRGFRWFFSTLQSLSGFVFARLGTRRGRPAAAPARGPAGAYPMDPYGHNVAEHFMDWVGLIGSGAMLAAALLPLAFPAAAGGSTFASGLLVAGTLAGALVLSLATGGVRQNRGALDLAMGLLLALGPAWVLLGVLAPAWPAAAVGAVLLLGLLVLWLARREGIRSRFIPRFCSLRGFETLVALADAAIEQQMLELNPIEAAIHADHLLAGTPPADAREIRRGLRRLEWLAPLVLEGRPLPFSALGTRERGSVLRRVAASRRLFAGVHRTVWRLTRPPCFPGEVPSAIPIGTVVVSEGAAADA